jgi:hypothetical protein
MPTARTFPFLLILAAQSACGSHDTLPAVVSGSTGGACSNCPVDGGGAGGSGGTTGGRPGSDAGGETGSFDSGGTSGDLGGIVVSDIANSPCVQTTATPVTVMESEPLLITYDLAGVAGTRRYAVDTGTLSMLTFDSDGANPSTIEPSILFARATADGRLAALTSDGSSLSLRFYDTSARALGGDVELTRGATGSPTLAAGPESELVLWQANDVLVGRFVNKDGMLGAAVDFGTGSCGSSNCTVRAVHNGRGFTVVWSRELQDQRTKTTWADVTNDGKVNFTKPVLLADGFHRIVDFLLTGSTYALLFGEGYPTRDAVLVFLDVYGNVTPPAKRLLGSVEPWGVAAASGGLAVTASLTDGRAALRSLTDSGDAAGSWTCLDDSAPDIGFGAHAAILTESTGYGVVVRMTDGSAAFLRIGR